MYSIIYDIELMDWIKTKQNQGIYIFGTEMDSI